MASTQIQIKISLSEQLNELLKSKAHSLGVPLTQFVKHVLIKEVEEDEYPTFHISERSEKRLKEAMKHKDKAVDASVFFKKIKNEG